MEGLAGRRNGLGGYKGGVAGKGRRRSFDTLGGGKRGSMLASVSSGVGGSRSSLPRAIPLAYPQFYLSLSHPLPWLGQTPVLKRLRPRHLHLYRRAVAQSSAGWPDYTSNTATFQELVA